MSQLTVKPPVIASRGGQCVWCANHQGRSSCLNSWTVCIQCWCILVAHFSKKNGGTGFSLLVRGQINTIGRPTMLGGTPLASVCSDVWWPSEVWSPGALLVYTLTSLPPPAAAWLRIFAPKLLLYRYAAPPRPLRTIRSSCSVAGNCRHRYKQSRYTFTPPAPLPQF